MTSNPQNKEREKKKIFRIKTVEKIKIELLHSTCECVEALAESKLDSNCTPANVVAQFSDRDAWRAIKVARRLGTDAAC